MTLNDYIWKYGWGTKDVFGHSAADIEGQLRRALIKLGYPAASIQATKSIAMLNADTASQRVMVEPTGYPIAAKSFILSVSVVPNDRMTKQQLDDLASVPELAPKNCDTCWLADMPLTTSANNPCWQCRRLAQQGDGVAVGWIPKGPVEVAITADRTHVDCKECKFETSEPPLCKGHTGGHCPQFINAEVPKYKYLSNKETRELVGKLEARIVALENALVDKVKPKEVPKEELCTICGHVVTKPDMLGHCAVKYGDGHAHLHCMHLIGRHK